MKNRHHVRGWRLNSWLLCAVALAAGPTGCLLDRSGPSNGAGGEGGMDTPTCDLATCPVPNDPCLQAACGDAECTTAPRAIGTVCDSATAMICNATGMCVESLGFPCETDAAICPSGTSCADGVCCASACSGSCQACNLVDSLGTCVTFDSGINPQKNGVNVCAADAVCDGVSECTAGATGWNHLLGDGNAQVFYDVAVDDQGASYFVGSFAGTLVLSSSVTLTAGNADGLLVKYDAAGEYVWHHQFTANACVLSGVDVRGDSVHVTGTFDGNVSGNFTTLLDNNNDMGVLVGKFNAAGQEQWLRAYGSTSYDEASRIKSDGTGNVLVSGLYYATFFAGSESTGNSGSGDAFVLKISPAGDALWVRGIGGSNYERPWGFDVNEAGEVAIAGETYGQLTAEGMGPTTAFGNRDCWISKLSAAGDPAWVRGYGGSQDDSCWAVAFDPENSGDIFFGGHFTGSITLGGDTLMDTGSAEDGFILHTASNGLQKFTHQVGQPGTNERVHQLKPIGERGWVIGGAYDSGWSPGSLAPLPGDESGDEVFVFRADAQFKPLWARAIASSTGVNNLWSVAIHADSSVVLTAGIEGNFDWFGVAQAAQGDADMFIARLTP